MPPHRTALRAGVRAGANVSKLVSRRSMQHEILMTPPELQNKREVRSRQSRRTFWLELALVVAITAIAVFLRYYKIGQVPPGFNSDEAVGAVGALQTLRRGPQLYYSGQGGGGSLGFYIAAIGFAIFGPGVATIRGTAAFIGVLGVVATYFATREMFRPHTGIGRARTLAALATLGLATSLWHTQSSRVAFAAVGVPFLQVPGNYFLWRGLNTGRRVHFIISGVFLASLMYIYMSGSFAPFFYLAFFLLQWLVTGILAFRQPSAAPDAPAALLRRHFWNLVVCAGIAFVLFLPMLIFYLTAPDLATERAQQALFTNPLINQGDPWGTLWRSLWGNLAAFGLSSSWLQGAPPDNLILPLPVSLLFLVGFVVSLWRVGQPPYLFILVYWGVMLLPSILTPDTIPHPLRAVGAAPAAYTLVAVGAVEIVDLGVRLARRGGDSFRVARTGRRSLEAGVVPTVVISAALGLVTVWPLYQSFRHYLVEWPKTAEAKAAYHVYAVKLAEEMSKETNPQATFLLPRDTAAGDVNPNYTVMFLYHGEAGYAWVVDDETTLEATLNQAVQGRDVVHVIRWKTSKHTGADPKEVIRYYLEKHGDLVGTRSFEYYDIDTYRLDRLGPDLTDGPLSSASIDFGNQIRLTGYAYGDASGAADPEAPSALAGDLLWVRLRLLATAPIEKELKASVVVSDSAGHVVGQVDKLLLSNLLHQDTEDWKPGDEVDAYFLVPVAPASPPGDYRLGLALYDADSLARLPSPYGDATQMVTLGNVAVRPDLSPPPIEALGISLTLDRPVTEELTLLGLTSSAGERVRPGEKASLALFWRAEEVPAQDYQVSLWAIRDDEAWALTETLPLAGIDYPTSQWVAGQVVRGWFDGQVPPDMENGEYGLSLRITGPDQALVTEVSLGALHVEGWPRRFDVPAMQYTSAASFADRIELLGYDMRLPDSLAASAAGREQQSLGVTLYWRALSKMVVGYTTFVHLLDETGQVVSQVDHVPGDGAFPTTGWLPGEVIADEFEVPWPDHQVSPSLLIEVGIYDPATGERLVVVDEAQAGDHIVLPQTILTTP
ncbi:MAG: hypothetical protein Kow0063_14510 [Anaerolineae bacterium]